MEQKCTAKEISRVKSLGFLRDKRTLDGFCARVITQSGMLSSEEFERIAEAARRYGSGQVAMTSRMTVEIQGVPYDNIQPLMDYLQAGGLETGGTGPRVRPVVSCKGTSCVYGLIDVHGLAMRIHRRFFLEMRDVKLPHKFKIGVGGCPNSCVKPDLNDLGVVGQRVPKIDLDKCRGCKVCAVEKACPMGAMQLAETGPVLDPALCNRCGRCVRSCPFGCFNEWDTGYALYIGGRWGKKRAVGKPLSRLLSSEDEVLEVVQRAIDLYRTQGIPGERFADTIERLGFTHVEKALLGG